jgi:hypothetical protein
LNDLKYGDGYFIIRIRKEMDPILNLVEYLREEDEVGGIGLA